MKFSSTFTLALAAAAMALPHRVPRDNGFALQNGQAAIAQK